MRFIIFINVQSTGVKPQKEDMSLLDTDLLSPRREAAFCISQLRIL
ncbi:MAG: hypothetical protein JWR15_259 [Prosthecobacter sp.]|nr:hypothetical protein [Prosthecobacter sp.]